MLMAEMKLSAHTFMCAAQGELLTMYLLDITLFSFPGQPFQRQPNVRGQVDPIENTVLQKHQRINKKPWCLKGLPSEPLKMCI